MSTSYIPQDLRRQTIDRAGNCCEYCRFAQDDMLFTFQIDHIIAEKHGGNTTLDNLCLSCPDCNAYKGSDIASVDWDSGVTIVPLFHPRQHTWADHFQVHTDGLMVPRTAIGRVTVRLLRLNDHDRVVDRKLFLDAGRYPCGNASETS